MKSARGVHRFALLVVILVAGVLAPGASKGDVPRTISHQGVLSYSSSGELVPVPDATYPVTFRIYSSESGEVALWTESHTVTVSHGIYSTTLGTNTTLDLPFDVQYWLGIQVGEEPELIPRLQLTAVPYAVRAAIADSLPEGTGDITSVHGDGGLVGTTLTGDAHLSVGAGTGIEVTEDAVQLAAPYASGSVHDARFVNEGQANAVTADMIVPTVVSSLDGVANDAGNIDLVAGANITITPDDANNRITVAATGVGGIGGGGTAAYIPRFLDATTLQNSAIYQSSGNIGIGTTAPATPLDVNGGINGSNFYLRGPRIISYVDSDTYRIQSLDEDNKLEINNTDVRSSGDFVPGTNVAYNCGLSTKRWSTVYAQDFNGSGTVQANYTGADAPGIYGQTYSSNGTHGGVKGKAMVDGGCGVYGETWSLGVSGGSSIALSGWCPASGGSVGGAALGVLGRVNSYQGTSASVPCGVFGWATATSGTAAGVWGESKSSTGFGVYGAATHTSGTAHGVVGRADSPNGRGVYFSGGLAGSGTKSAVVRTSRGPTLLYCQESPENWFEDFGTGRLERGKAAVPLDPVFLETVTVNPANPMMVFVQLNDDCQGVYVKRHADSFEVIELNGGTSSAAFTYRVVAKRKGYEENRLDVFEPGREDPHLYPESGIVSPSKNLQP